MRICLSTTSYPPESMGGIPRQRQILANALVKQGHEIHVIVQGKRQATTKQNNVIIHSVPFVRQPFTYSEKYPALNYRLTHSQAIQEQVRVLNQEHHLDVLDVPLWGLEGMIPIYADEMPVVLWLQTSFAQLVEMGQQTPRVDDVGVIAMEKECLARAHGIIADSQTVLTDFEKLYGLKGLQQKSCVVHLGLPDLPVNQRPHRREGESIEALLVGRLEMRKGTPNIFEVLPELLRADRHLRVRFIGEDNSRWDGFYQKCGQTYPEYFHTHWPGLRGRVIFEGAVSDQRLVEAYNQADLMLVPSIYESFGLIYLEAMRAGLPIVTFALGAAPEIFANGEQDGAVIVPPQDNQAFLQATQDLISNGRKRQEIGSSGRECFTRSFLDTQMAAQTAEYYREVIATFPHPTIARPRRIFQVMEALDAGDAVSTIALNNAELMRQMHVGGKILSQHVHPKLVEKRCAIDQFDLDSKSALIFHYWNYSYLEDFIRSFHGPKAMHFHNITPPKYFSPDSPGFEATSRGYRQLPEIVNLFDLLIGDSTFNLETCKPFLTAPKPGIVIPPLVEAEAVRARAYDAHLLENLKKQPGLKILFVGRIARNKRQDRLIELCEALSALGTTPWLYLVGSDQGDPQYRQELDLMCNRLPQPESVVLTGKVSDEALYSYYRAADVFVSASEHEGFGLPLVEAMALDVPVLAYAAGAVPETLGKAGVLVQNWDIREVAQQIQQLSADPALRRNVLTAQCENMKRFTADAVKERLTAIARFLQNGEFTDLTMMNISTGINKIHNGDY